MSYISARGYSLPKDAIEATEYKKIKEDLTVKPFCPPGFGGEGGQKQKPNKLYVETATRIYMPKFYGILNFGKPEGDKRPDGRTVEFTFKGSLRQEQEEPVKACMNAIEDESVGRGGILNVFCGGGKTSMALYIMSQVGRKTLIIVHKDFLLNQWKERIEQFCPGVKIGLIKAKVIDVDADIVLASLQSLSMKEYPAYTFEDFGLTIIDEVHHTSAEVFSRALRKIGACKRTLGLSATIQRKDGLTKVFIWHLGDVLYSAAKRNDTDVVVDVIPFESADCTYCEEPVIHTGSRYGPSPNMARMINNICAFGPRNDLIVSKIKDIFQKEPMRKMLVLSDRRAHLVGLIDIMKAECPDLSTGLYVGGMKASALAECETKQIIFATYAIASEGYDQPGLDTLILATPKSDVVQSVGRILREKQELRKHAPLIVDIVDQFSLFPRQFGKRKAFFKKSHFVIRTASVASQPCLP
jgi:hypothetical protein